MRLRRLRLMLEGWLAFHQKHQLAKKYLRILMFRLDVNKKRKGLRVFRNNAKLITMGKL
jgi:hypothetical protein